MTGSRTLSGLPTRPASGRVGTLSVARALVYAGVSLAVGSVPSAHAAEHQKDPAPRPITVTSLGGALQDAQQKAFFGPFTAASHIPVRLAGWDGLLATLQNRARLGVPGTDRDLVLMENSSVGISCQQGLFMPVDPAWLAGSPPPNAISRCGIGALRTDLVLAWDKSRIDTAPSWADFWDVARRPGKRGLRRDPRGTLEIALLADGVAPDEVYRTLGTADGLDRAFRKLDQLRPYIVWWDTPAEAVQIIESGAVLMTSAPNGEVASANQVGHRDFGIQWQQSVSMMLSWAIPGRPVTSEIGAEREARIRQLLSFMNDPARQADFVQRYAAVSLVPGVPPAGQALPEDSPATPEHLHDALAEDDGFWLTHLEQVKARFDTWIDH